MGKSSHHKDKNTHRFVSFSERISSITIDVIHRIRRVDDDPTAGTYFGDCLKKWTNLDLTEQFTTFRQEISNQVKTYEQLVHHEAQIITALKKHLQIPKSSALPALQELLVQLARDLQQDFLPHMPVFFSLLVAKLEQEKQNANILESIFQTLALLFRMLWRYLIKDFKQLFGYFSELLVSKQKDYIQVFAAESCAYLLRKVKKKNELLNYLFMTLKTSPQLTDGVGLLLFEMMKGVQGHFHTVSDEVFPLILHKLGPWSPSGKKVNLPRSAVEQAVTVLIQDLSEHGNKETCKQLWTQLLDCTEHVHAACLEIEGKENIEKDMKGYVGHLCRLLRMISLWLSHKNGNVISDPEKIAVTLLVIAKSPCGSESLGHELLQTISKLLTYFGDSLSGETILKLVSLAFQLPVSLSELQTFMLTLVDAPFFEKDVLVCCIKRVDHELKSKGQDVKDEILAFITSVVLDRRNSPVAGDGVLLLQAYPLDLLYSRATKSYPFADLVSSVIEGVPNAVTDKQIEWNALLAAVIIAPHLRIRELTKKLMVLWKKLANHLKTTSDTGQASRQLFVLNEILKGILISILPGKEQMPVDVDDVFTILRAYPTLPVALQLADFFLSYPECKNHLTTERLTETYAVLEENLTSPSHHIRLLTCHILSLFPVELPDFGDNVQRDNVFQILWAAENIELNVQTYRDKLVQLQKLDFSAVSKCLPNGKFEKVALLFLFGNEFWNFKFLWGPLTDIISTHAYGLKLQEFWSILIGQLRRAADESAKELRPSKADHRFAESSVEDSSALTTLMNEQTNRFLEDERKPDFSLYRVNLWKLMKKFPDKCSQKSDDLCTLYLDFIKQEFPNVDGDRMKYQNIMLREASEALARKEEEEAEVAMEVDENDDKDVNAKVKAIRKPTQSSSNGRQGKSVVQTLLVHLDLFAMFKKHSMFTREEVKQTFHDFLMSTTGSIQKAAFEVILTYKSKHIVPYKENFYRLLDDDTFKTEIVFFRVDDEEHTTLKEEDRDGLLPVLMRILYGKMRGKAGKDTSGKSRGNLRRSLVLRFLGGCKPEELKYFLDLLFRPCQEFCADDPHAMVCNVADNLDLRKMMPLKKMKGILSTILMVTQQLGHRLESACHSILNILLGMAATLTAALDRREDIFTGYISSLKSLRHEVMDRIVQFFESYDSLDFTELEMKAVFQAVVWPQAEKLALEGVHHPTPLLKLFSAWSNSYRLLPLLGHAKENAGSDKLPRLLPLLGHAKENAGTDKPPRLLPLLGHAKENAGTDKPPRLLPLLGHAKENAGADNDQIVSPLSSMFKLLNASAIKPPVVTAILDIVQQLLLKDKEWELEGELDPLPGCFDYSQEGKVNDSEDQEWKELGRSILQPQIPLLLTFLHTKLARLKSKDSRKQKLAVELKILARVSSFVVSPEECHSLCSLLIPYLSRSCKLSEEVEENTLRSAINLMQYVAKPTDYYKMACQLFGVVERRGSRVLLCKLFKTISALDERLSDFAILIQKLNSWDSRRAEEPDYSARLEAFQLLNMRLNSMTSVDMDLILPCIYNCTYFIRGVDDLSIRDNSTFCITTLIKKISELDEGNCNSKAFQSVHSEILIKLVKAGFRSKVEAVRHEFIAILQCLVTTYPNSRLFLGLPDLNDQDPEANFFENIRHIQIYKRARGLRRVYRYLNNHTLGTEIHVSYFIPLIYSFITERTYAKHGNIQDGAVDLLGTICKQLPWGAYSSILEFYLHLLPKMADNQRQIIRIIVALLNGFHFDLSQSTFKERFTPKQKEKENSDQKDKDETEVAEGDKGDEDEEDEKVDDTLPMDLGVTEMEGQELTRTADRSDKAKVGTGSDEEGEEAERKIVMILCSEEAATKIHQTLVKKILPKLHAAITQRSKGDADNKSASSQHQENDEVLRVPLALAVIKLLQQLPKGTLEIKLPGVLLKICNFLRSRSQDVRNTARETLVKAAMSLGARFFPFILKEMRACLERGYQLHVLSFTTYHLLRSLLPIFTPGDLDPVIGSVQAIYNNEMFGFQAEEKEVKAIKDKFFEAKVIKGFDSYEILAKLISAVRLEDLIKPIREILMSTHSQRIANKADGLLKRIASGLTSNPSIPLPAMMVFINSLTTKLVPDLVEIIQPKVVEEPENKSLVLQSCLLLERAKPRGGDKPKVSKRTNVHVLVEFGLQLLFSKLKQSSLKQTDQVHLQMLDPLIPAVMASLDDTHAKTNAGAMRCLIRLLAFPLPSLHRNINKIAKSIFVVLQNYAGAVRAKGDNLELITMTFKAMTVLVREVTSFKMTTDQLQVLLTYCEEDLYNYERQSTAFDLIKSILSRKLNIPQLHQVINKLFELSISAGAADTRLHSRQLVTYYLMNYPHGKGIRKHLDFYLDHLGYELEDGRASALEMLISMFSSFPVELLNNHCMRFFHPLSMASYNDDSLKCRKLVVVALKMLLGKISSSKRGVMFRVIYKWIQSDDLRLRAMGCHVCGLFVEVEGGSFSIHQKSVVPLLQQMMEPGRYPVSDEEDISTDENVEQKDVCLLAVINAFLKIAKELNVVRLPELTHDINLIWNHLSYHLLYPQFQVRLVSSQVLGVMFNVWDPQDIALTQQKKTNGVVGSTEMNTEAEKGHDEEVSEETNDVEDDESDSGNEEDMDVAATTSSSTHGDGDGLESKDEEKEKKKKTEEEPTETEYLLDNTVEKMKSLCLCFCYQIRTPEIDDALATQIIKNLLYIARVAEAMGNIGLLVWVAKKIMREAHFEVQYNVKHTPRRTHTFKWVAAVGVTLSQDSVVPILPVVLPHLQRQLAEESPSNETLKTLSQEVVELLKKQVGVEAFTSAFVTSQRARQDKRDYRKRQHAEEAVTDPALAARRKVQRTWKKDAAKKRKMEEWKPTKRLKKSKLSILNIKVDDD